MNKDDITLRIGVLEKWIKVYRSLTLGSFAFFAAFGIIYAVFQYQGNFPLTEIPILTMFWISMILSILFTFTFVTSQTTLKRYRKALNESK